MHLLQWLAALLVAEAQSLHEFFGPAELEL